jgi:UDP-2,3-diacylglucosamine hydrolase
MTLGLILGNGKYATFLHEKLRRTGIAHRSIAVVDDIGVRHSGQIDGDLDGVFRLSEIDEGIADLAAHGVDRVVFGGDFRAIEHVSSDRPSGPPVSVAEFVRQIHAKLEQSGICPEHAGNVLPEIRVAVGCLAGPSRLGTESREEVDRRVSTLAQLARTLMHGSEPLLTVRQAIVFDHFALVEMVGAHGTDDVLDRIRGVPKRAGTVRALVKLASNAFDPRFDPPVIGLKTIEGAVAARVSLIVLDSGAGILCDRQRVLQTCNAKGICLFGVAPSNGAGAGP